MPTRDFLFLALICLSWAFNLVLTRWILGDLQVPGLFLAALRMLLLCLVLIPFLRPVPRQIGAVFLVSMGVGAAHYALLLIGLTDSTASAAAIVLQLEIPFTTLLSIIFLGERIGIRRTVGIVLSVAGVSLIVFDPGDFSISRGLALIAASTMVWAAASIVMKKMEPIHPLRLQGWVAAFSALPLLAASALFENRQIDTTLSGGWPLISALAFAVFVVSIFGHGGYYSLIKRHDVTLVAPLSLMTPLFTVIFGVTLLGEPLTWKLLGGGVMCLLGVGVIAKRSHKALVSVPRRPTS